ncbi:MAG: flagellar export chaperone FlgN [Burkholderiales bacterium]|nr:flagellar export chaperone FlgN [Burkholderiales bacterium]
MPSPTDSVIDALAAELSAALALEALLEREAAELPTCPPETIEALALEKTELARRSAERARAREAAQGAAGLPPGAEGLKIACERSGPRARQRLDAFRACVRRISEANERNGALIDLKLKHASAALAVLLTGSPEATPVYSRDGLAHAGNLTRSRASA